MRSTGEYLKDRGHGKERVDLGFWCSVKELRPGDVVYVNASNGVSWEGLYSIISCNILSSGKYTFELSSVPSGRREKIVLSAHQNLRLDCCDKILIAKYGPVGKKLFS